MLLNKINEAFQKARKDDDKLRKTLLSVLLGEIQLAQGKVTDELTDKQILKITKKLKKSCDEMCKLGCATSGAESFILEEFLPEALTKDEIECIIVASPLYQEILDLDNPMRLTSKATALISETGKDFNGKDVSDVMRTFK